MRKMKDSGIEWIGKIPESWSVRRIKFTLDSHSGGAWGSNEGEEERNAICVRVADFDYSQLLVNLHDKMTVRSYPDKIIRESSIQNGDILLEKSGGGEVTPVGRSVLFNSDEKMMCANFIEMLRTNDHYDSRFLNYWLSAAYVNGLSKRNVKQTTGIQNLDVAAFLSERIASPEVEAQTLIADYLDKKCAEIDALIKAKKKTNALLKEQRQSIIYEAVRKGIDPDAPMKDSGIEWIGKIPESWEVRRVRSEFSFGKGLSITKSDLKEKGVRVISYGQIHSKTNIGTTVKEEMIRFVDEEFLNTNSSSLTEKGDIVFADTSEDLLGCGNCVYIDTDEPIFAGYHTIIARPNERKNAKYYSYLFSTDAWRSQIRSKVSGVKLFSITQAMLRDGLIVLPCEKDMNDVVDLLDEQCATIDKIIAANNTTIEQLKEYRKSVIFEAVTGKVKI